MTNKLQCITRYIVLHYPYKDELTISKLSDMVYLADWYFAREYHKQMTDIEWILADFGAYSGIMGLYVYRDKKLCIRETKTAFNRPQRLVVIKDGLDETDLRLDRLSQDEIDILNKVIRVVGTLTSSEFFDYIRSTYPIKSQIKGESLNLVELSYYIHNKS